MAKTNGHKALWLDPDFVLFNFVMNLWPDNQLCNSHLRPFIARLLGLRCGQDCQIRSRTYFERHRKIDVGKNVFLNRQSYFDAGGGITIGDNVRFGPQVMLITGSHQIGPPEMRAGGVISKEIRVEDGCWIGARVTITAGVTIGKGCVVSAGAVVQRSMPPGFLIAGNPARPLYRVDQADGSRPGGD